MVLRTTRLPKRTRTSRLGILAGILVIVSTTFYAVSLGSNGSSTHRRQLLSSGAEWEQCGYEQQHSPGGFIFLYALLTFHLFLGVAILCDDYFVPSLEGISEALNLSEDVAGATFMAAGSSAPELFTSLVGISVDSDVGVGTIFGSAVFNILVIVALSAAFAGQVLHLDWKVLMRDSIVYGVSIVLFTVFVWDGYFELYEAILLLLLYVGYLVLMVYNKRVMAWVENKTRSSQVHPVLSSTSDVSLETGGPNLNLVEGCVTPPTSPEKETLSTGEQRSRGQSTTLSNPRIDALAPGRPTSGRSDSVPFQHVLQGRLSAQLQGGQGSRSPKGSISSMNSRRSQSIPAALTKPSPLAIESNIAQQASEQFNNANNDEHEVCYPASCMERACYPCNQGDTPVRKDNPNTSKLLAIVSHAWSWFIYILSIPYVWAFTNTIPPGQTYYVSSFCACVAWIAALSFVMVMIVARTGCIMGIDSYVMGLIVVAAGTSIPDAISSILVAQDGYGDMAVSNAIGSNVFDIDLGLGFPFILKILVDGRRLDLLSAVDRLAFDSGAKTILDHAKFGFILLGILFGVLASFVLSKFRLTKTLGMVFFAMYIVFIAYALIQELVCNANGNQC